MRRAITGIQSSMSTSWQEGVTKPRRLYSS
jgi:hypothetical protein